MHDEILHVYYRGELVGTIAQAVSRHMEFVYAPEWLGKNDAFAISHSLPLDGGYARGTVDHFYFANLLPEGEARGAVCRRLGLSESNDFELLRRIGAECAGALSILPAGVEATAAGSYRPISEQEMELAVNSPNPGFRQFPAGRTRFSFAGRQDKWAVYLDKDGNKCFPEGNAPSTHMLKFDSRDYKGTAWNEAYVSFLARHIGVPSVEIRPFTGYSLIRRYDRETAPDGGIERIHQEDFCQALGLSAGEKYTDQGGPCFNKCLSLIAEVSTRAAADSIALIGWHIANVLLGNADGHAKNLSFILAEGGWRLAPFYDLVCTAVYEVQGVDGRLAMPVGDQRDPGQIREADWEKLARDAGMNPRIVLGKLDDMSRKLSERISLWTDEFHQNNGENKFVDASIRSAISERVRRIRTLAFGRPAVNLPLAMQEISGDVLKE